MAWGDRTDLFFDRQGQPMSVVDFEAFYTGPNRVAHITVARDQICHVQVSTVWLGTNYNFGDEGPPTIFETMTFCKNDELWDSRMFGRYCTEGQAMAGHLVVCWAVRSHLRQLAP